MDALPADLAEFAADVRRLGSPYRNVITAIECCGSETNDDTYLATATEAEKKYSAFLRARDSIDADMTTEMKGILSNLIFIYNHWIPSTSKWKSPEPILTGWYSPPKGIKHKDYQTVNGNKKS